MSSILTSQGVVLATAMAAVSGTVILLALRHQKFSHTPRPCLSSSDGKRRARKKKKRVHFADDVMEPSGDSVEFRMRHRKIFTTNSPKPPSSVPNLNSNGSEIDDDGGRRGEKNERKITGMPANRVALYNGMLRDRVGHRLGCSY